MHPLPIQFGPLQAVCRTRRLGLAPNTRVTKARLSSSLVGHIAMLSTVHVTEADMRRSDHEGSRSLHSLHGALIGIIGESSN